MIDNFMAKFGSNLKEYITDLIKSFALEKLNEETY
jgi:hypothetical protein